MLSSRHDAKGHSAGFAAAKTPLENSSQGSLRSEQCEGLTSLTAEAHLPPI